MIISPTTDDNDRIDSKQEVPFPLQEMLEGKKPSGVKTLNYIQILNESRKTC